MALFEESDLRFRFGKQWRVFKFDQHRFYRYLSGYGLKGVDFMGLQREAKRLLLVEVKNFAPDTWSGQSPNMQAVLERPEQYAEEMARKFSDSFQLIGVIKAYYEKKWWLRSAAGFLQNWLPGWLLARLDYSTWTLAHHILSNYPERVQLVLWLEVEDGVDAGTREEFYRQLHQHLVAYFSKNGYQFTLANSQHPLSGLDFTIGK